MSNIIVMAFSPRNIIGCFLKKRLTKGGGGSRAPQDPPRYALEGLTRLSSTKILLSTMYELLLTIFNGFVQVTVK